VFFSPPNITNVHAIDGYKDVKFGASKKVVLARKWCSFNKGDSGQAGVELYSCNDFQFVGQSVDAGALFINNKFLRFIITVPVDHVKGIVSGLTNKYGEPSSKSPQGDFAAVDRNPNRQAYLAFDRNTIIFQLMSDQSLNQSAILIYTSPEYEKSLIELQRKSAGNDL